jgi:hypothetical protein
MDCQMRQASVMLFSMRKHPRLLPLAAAVVLSASSTLPALAAAQTPFITGNYWVAIAIALAFIAVIVLTVMSAIGLFRRNAKRGRRGDGGFGLFGSDDD